MIRELVDGSAWIGPPVEGEPLPCSAEVAVTCTWGAPPAWVLLPTETDMPGVPLPLFTSFAAIAARSVVAMRVASAFLRCTTQILPASPFTLWLLMAGWSSRRIRLRAWVAWALVGARTISALLRASASTVVRPKPPPAPPGAAAAAVLLPSSSFCTSGAMSVAMP